MLRAGFARVDITPPINVWLSGYAARTSPAVGIHDELRATALVLSYDEQKAAIVALDLIGLDFATVDSIRKLSSEWAGVSDEALIINCSHTHSGPMVSRLRAMGDVNRAYVETLPMRVATAIKLAHDNLKPAKILLGVCEGAIGINRRERKPDGSIQIGRNPEGPVDPNVYVLRVENESGATMGIVVHHAAHAVVLGPNNLLVSADYPGAAVRAIERAFGDGTIAMFLQGCCGNINANREKGTFEECERIGTALAGAALRAASFATEVEPTPIVAKRRMLQLPLMSPPSKDELREMMQSYRRDLDEARRSGDKVRERLATAMLNWTEEVIKLTRSRRASLKQQFEMSALRVGNLAILGLSGEVFIEYALSIRSSSPFRETFVLGYTNGCIGYVPTASAYDEGGYEIDMAYKYYGTLMLAPDCEKLILSEAESLLNELSAHK
ncbi:MAG: neutral/alkaline non-lysosomal ceramidase N-terminal domain-containing protein [Armatimonadota bacterium]|nr:neutral/alkaline non-lysosomal ceramidase N-terminal domain-containing protein [Armatimonadota bacterium]MDW8024936.1 neutral/alkaline non-lysosomal ceramidase N-terminal domain-containing protein [Armatimonadota bacterium]